MITGYFAAEIRRLNRNLARLGLVLFALALLWVGTLERAYWRRLVDAAQGWPLPLVPAVLAAGGVYCSARAFRRSLSLRAHPRAQTLARAPAGSDLEAVAAQLDQGWTIRAPFASVCRSAWATGPRPGGIGTIP